MRRAIIIAATLVLSGCSGDLFSFGGSDDDAAAPIQQPVAVAQTPAPANDKLCRNVAVQDAKDNGFDQETQVKVATRSYQQCMAIYSTNASR